MNCPKSSCRFLPIDNYLYIPFVPQLLKICFVLCFFYRFCPCVFERFIFLRSGAKRILKYHTSWYTIFWDKIWLSETNSLRSFEIFRQYSCILRTLLRWIILYFFFSKKFFIKNIDSLKDHKKSLDIYFAIKSQMFWIKSIMWLLDRWKKVVEQKGTNII